MVGPTWLRLLDFYLHQRCRVVFVEVGRAEGHQWLFEYRLLLAAHLVVLNKEIPMLGLSVSAIDLLLQAFSRLYTLARGLVARLHGHITATVALFPRRTVCGHFVKVVLCHAHRVKSLGELLLGQVLGLL